MYMYTYIIHIIGKPAAEPAEWERRWGCGPRAAPGAIYYY